LQLLEDGVTGGLSISHDGEYVVAMAMLPPKEPGTIARMAQEAQEAQEAQAAQALYG
jgi:hypothetical protein